MTLRSFLRRFGLALASDLERAEKAWFYHNARATALEEDRRRPWRGPTIVTVHEQVDVEPGRKNEVRFVSDYARPSDALRLKGPR